MSMVGRTRACEPRSFLLVVVLVSIDLWGMREMASRKPRWASLSLPFGHCETRTPHRSRCFSHNGLWGRNAVRHKLCAEVLSASRLAFDLFVWSEVGRYLLEPRGTSQ